MVSTKSGGTAQLRRRLSGLWRNPDFLCLWVGETVSLFGSQITALALPLTAVVALKAMPLEVALLGAAGWGPYLLVSLSAGLWVDRQRRHPVLVASNIGRAALLTLVPLCYALGILRIELLYVVAFLVGTLAVFFSLAYGSYLPALVPDEQLVEGNTKLQASASITEIGGPSLAGLLIQILSAPFTIVLDTLSFLLSALSLMRIQKPEPEPVVGRERVGVRREIGDGLRITFGNPYLRAVCGEAATYNLFEQIILVLWVVYATRELGLAPALLSMIMGTGAIGALLGSLSAARIAALIGFGSALIGSMAVCCAALSLIPLAGGSTTRVVATLAMGFFLNGIGLGMSNVHVRSLLQAVTPKALMGRVLASYGFFNTGAISLGALLAGLLQGKSVSGRA